MIDVSEVRQLKKGQHLIRQGEKPTHIYFLISGVIRGFFTDTDGNDITDCIVYRCGDPANADNDWTLPASTTMEAVEDCKIVCIAVDEIECLLREYPDLMKL